MKVANGHHCTDGDSPSIALAPVGHHNRHSGRFGIGRDSHPQNPRVDRDNAADDTLPVLSRVDWLCVGIPVIDGVVLRHIRVIARDMNHGVEIFNLYFPEIDKFHK